MEKYNDDWYEQVSEAQDYVQINIDDVRSTNTRWQQISEHVSSGDLDNEAMIEAAKQVLTSDQDASVRSLLEQAQKVPYEEVTKYMQICQERIDVLNAKLSEIENSLSEEQQRLLTQRELLESLAPNASSALAATLEAELQKVKSDEVKEVREQLGQATLDLEFAESLFEKTGQAWPIPQLADVNYEPGEDEVFTIDEFPNEREQTSEDIRERVTRKFESRLSDASVYLALLLKEKPGHIWSPEELGGAVYRDGSDGKRNAGRITSLISNYRHGKAPAMAEEIGSELVLQRGKRQLFDAKTGKSIPNTIRVVWRLVDIDTATNAQIVTTLNSERTLRQSYGEWEPTDISKIRLQNIPSGDYDGKTIVDVDTEGADEPEQESLQEKADWKEAFTDTVHQTIESMKESKLLDEPEVTWQLLSLLSDSAKAGTKEMRERALKNKIIKRSQVGDGARISATQAVMAMLQNGHPNIFRAASRRKQAVHIVDEILEGYFRQHKDT